MAQATQARTSTTIPGNMNPTLDQLMELSDWNSEDGKNTADYYALLIASVGLKVEDIHRPFNDDLVVIKSDGPLLMRTEIQHGESTWALILPDGYDWPSYRDLIGALGDLEQKVAMAGEQS